MGPDEELTLADRVLRGEEGIVGESSSSMGRPFSG